MLVLVQINCLITGILRLIRIKKYVLHKCKVKLLCLHACVWLRKLTNSDHPDIFCCMQKGSILFVIGKVDERFINRRPHSDKSLKI